MDRTLIDLIELGARRASDDAASLAKELQRASAVGYTSPEGRVHMRHLLRCMRTFVDNATAQLKEP